MPRRRCIAPSSRSSGSTGKHSRRDVSYLPQITVIEAGRVRFVSLKPLAGSRPPGTQLKFRLDRLARPDQHGVSSRSIREVNASCRAPGSTFTKHIHNDVARHLSQTGLSSHFSRSAPRPSNPMVVAVSHAALDLPHEISISDCAAMSYTAATSFQHGLRPLTRASRVFINETRKPRQPPGRRPGHP